MKRQLVENFHETEVPISLRKHILKHSDGFTILRDLCNSLSIPLQNMSNVQKYVISVRNRVLYGGYEPISSEAFDAYACTRLTLKALNIPIFEEASV